MKKLTTLLLLAALSSSAFSADETSINEMPTYRWKNSAGSNTYSDKPLNLKPALAEVVNIRTGTVTKAIVSQNLPTTAAEAQQLANQLIAEENKRAQEAHEKQKQEIRAENCKSAQINRAAAQNARNSAELIPKYEADIAKYCQ